jgi:hypothetical protein
MRFTATALFLAALLAGHPSHGQEVDYTTPEGAATVHQAIGAQILTYQTVGEVDRIYFTALLSWRCGTSAILYGLNDDPPETPFVSEPCYREFRDPNVLQHVGTPESPFFIDVPKESVQKVTVRVVYEDGKTADFVSERAKNLIP